MPGFDGTGPQAYGPMTGRGLGNCRGGDTRSFSGGQGRGFGRGMGRGMGRGAARSVPYGVVPAEPTPAIDEAAWLRQEREALERSLADVRARLSELDAQGAE